MSAETRQQPPNERLMQCITGHWVAAATYVAAKLGIADYLADGPKTGDEVAAAVGSHSPSTYRLLRALAALGILQETNAHAFTLTEVGELLQTDHPKSMRSMALFQGADPHWRGWGNLLHTVKTGEAAFADVHGMGFFDYCKTDDDFSEAFNGAMTGMSAAASEAVVDAYDFSGINELVDVGGGHGYLLSRILQKHDQMNGILCDLPHVVEGASAKIEEMGLSSRCELVGVDFFESVPAGDAYIAKNIIHDWDDVHAVKILSNMRESMEGNGKVLLVEAVITDDNRNSTAIMIDLEMLHATHGGRERTRNEFDDLFRQVGLKLSRVVETQSIFCVVEAIPTS